MRQAGLYEPVHVYAASAPSCRGPRRLALTANRSTDSQPLQGTPSAPRAQAAEQEAPMQPAACQEGVHNTGDAQGPSAEGRPIMATVQGLAANLVRACH